MRLACLCGWQKALASSLNYSWFGGTVTKSDPHKVEHMPENQEILNFVVQTFVPHVCTAVLPSIYTCGVVIGFPLYTQEPVRHTGWRAQKAWGSDCSALQCTAGGLNTILSTNLKIALHVSSLETTSPHLTNRHNGAVSVAGRPTFCCAVHCSLFRPFPEWWWSILISPRQLEQM